jgi:PleD family two-component response regulator
MKQRASRPESLLFIGEPDRRELSLLRGLRGTLQVKQVSDVMTAYRNIAKSLPDFVFFSVSQQNTDTLRLFRKLKRIDRLCVVVCHDTDMQAFIGKGYSNRCWLPKSIPGATVLQSWKTQMIGLCNAEDRRRIVEAVTLQQGVVRRRALIDTEQGAVFRRRRLPLFASARSA